LRIWRIHPKYLDWKGLGALWRETLLAQAVLMGKTKGWKNHPQLTGLREHPQPIKAVGYFLKEVYLEAKGRGYNYNYGKILEPVEIINQIAVSDGQLRYEFEILMGRLKERTPEKYWSNENLKVKDPEPHPLFKVVKGSPAEWEKSYWKNEPKNS
jgi:hypothetical protein